MTTYYHYTIEYKAALIFESGALLPMGTAGGKEKPLLWLSLNRVYERTAIKLLSFPGGRVYQPTLYEYRQRFTLWRFKWTTDAYVMGWERACKFAGTSNKHRRGMERVGKQQGGNPKHWYALSGPLPLTEVTPQVYDEDVADWVDWDVDRHGMPKPAPANIRQQSAYDL